MTRIVTNGWEMGDAVPATLHNGMAIYDTSSGVPVASGEYTLAAVSSGSRLVRPYTSYPLGDEYATLYLAINLYVSDTDISHYYSDDTSYYRYMSLIALGHGNNTHVKVSLEQATRQLALQIRDADITDGYDGLLNTNRDESDDYVAWSTSPLPVGRHVLLEMYIHQNDSAGHVQIRIDGNEVLSYTGDTNPSSTYHMDTLYLAPCYTLYDGTVCYDDIKINDDTGSTDNSWIGYGKIYSLTPDGNGGASDWLGNDGDSVDNYLLADDIPDDGDATYVESDTTGDTDLYTVTSLSDTDVTINDVWVTARGKDVSASGKQVNLVLNSSSNHETTVTLPSDYDDNLESDHYPQNPDTASDWTMSDLDALQVGVKVP